MSLRQAGLVYLTLLALLALTVGSTLLDLGPTNTVLNLAIAAAKAVLIGLFFMHLRQSGMLISLVVGALGFWLAILFGLTLADFITR
ncbi:MAG TPA: cytochrome C oxidase subunit IV family protein [Devosia sp.]|nr:cytochrome C oxidase subunit IV family protein [Devosia sp.]